MLHNSNELPSINRDAMRLSDARTSSLALLNEDHLESSELFHKPNNIVSESRTLNEATKLKNDVHKNSNDKSSSKAVNGTSIEKIKKTLTGTKVADVIEKLVAQRKAMNPNGAQKAPQIVVVAPLSDSKKKNTTFQYKFTINAQSRMKTTTPRPKVTRTTSKFTIFSTTRLSTPKTRRTSKMSTKAKYSSYSSTRSTTTRPTTTTAQTMKLSNKRYKSKTTHSTSTRSPTTTPKSMRTFSASTKRSRSKSVPKLTIASSTTTELPFEIQKSKLVPTQSVFNEPNNEEDTQEQENVEVVEDEMENQTERRDNNRDLIMESSFRESVENPTMVNPTVHSTQRSSHEYQQSQYPMYVPSPTYNIAPTSPFKPIYINKVYPKPQPIQSVPQPPTQLVPQPQPQPQTQSVYQSPSQSYAQQQPQYTQVVNQHPQQQQTMQAISYPSISPSSNQNIMPVPVPYGQSSQPTQSYPIAQRSIQVMPLHQPAHQAPQLTSYHPNNQQPIQMQHNHAQQLQLQQQQSQPVGQSIASPTHHMHSHPHAQMIPQPHLRGPIAKPNTFMHPLPPKPNRAINLSIGGAKPLESSNVQTYHKGYNEPSSGKGVTFKFGGGPVGGGGQVITSPLGIFKTLLLPLLPRPRVNLNGKVVFGVVLENGVGFGKKPKVIAQHFSEGKF